VAESPFASPHLPSSKISNPEICNSDFRSYRRHRHLARSEFTATFTSQVLDAIQPWDQTFATRGIALPEKENEMNKATLQPVESISVCITLIAAVY